MGTFYYVSHPNVEIDPDVPVPNWSLSQLGRERAVAMLDQPWVGAADRVISSSERKALETAQFIADATGLEIEIRTESGETDRSATGFVPQQRHEELADQFFADPEKSADGWERALDAQARIVAAMQDVFIAGEDTTIAVGHGAVGTLLMAHLAKLPIDRQFDQPGQGHYWAFDCATQSLLHRWRPIERD